MPCERAYIGKTTQCLSERAKQHIPNKLLETPPVLWSAKTDSAISKHLKENPECISEDLRKNFSVLAQARSQAHLNVLEALFIQAKSPVLCSQKDFVRVLSLFSVATSGMVSGWFWSLVPGGSGCYRFCLVIII